MRTPRKLPYREGDLFAVPLEGGGFGVGLVARMDGRGVVLGYFAPARFGRAPTLASVVDVWAVPPILVEQFGDLGLLDGTWPVLGQLPGWRREAWPMPAFGHRELITGRYLRVEYADDGSDEVSRTPISRAEFDALPTAGLAGKGFLEKRLAGRIEHAG